MDRAARVPVRAMVRRLRRELGEHADDPTYIFAEPCVGYRMARDEGRGSSEGLTNRQQNSSVTCPPSG